MGIKPLDYVKEIEKPPLMFPVVFCLSLKILQLFGDIIYIVDQNEFPGNKLESGPVLNCHFG